MPRSPENNMRNKGKPLLSVKSQIAVPVHHLIYENDDAHCAQLNNTLVMNDDGDDDDGVGVVLVIDLLRVSFWFSN